MIYQKWNAKDILGHLTFWHESFARNVEAIALEDPLNVLRGKLSEVNQRSVDSTREVPIATLIERFNTAQSVIEAHIHSSNIELIPYKKGSRSYTPQEHLEVVTAHIKRHLKDLKKAYKSA